MNRRTAISLTTMALLCLAVGLPASNAVAQGKQHVSFKASGENSKIVQQLNVDVGDVPNHIVRVYETRISFSTNAPVINGVKLVEIWQRGIVDYIDTSGPGTQYNVFMMENGDKFFVRLASVAQTTSGKVASTIVGNITGGTGKFAGIQGMVRSAANIDYKTSSVESQFDIDYAVGK